MTRYFAYGSHMARAEIESFCPDARFLGRARLDGYRLEFRRRSIRWGGGAADIVPAPGESVWGALYELPDGALERLDAKEGAGFAYRRRDVRVSCGDEIVAATAYEVIDKEAEQVEPTAEYLELLRAGARERGIKPR
jgi:gamma-glutamylcyclotransferase (GGCT)/AIG2-like uncharacterized protein YtfP